MEGFNQLFSLESMAASYSRASRVACSLETFALLALANFADAAFSELDFGLHELIGPSSSVAHVNLAWKAKDS